MIMVGVVPFGDRLPVEDPQSVQERKIRAVEQIHR
jgi:hypothetical protein